MNEPFHECLEKVIDEYYGGNRSQAARCLHIGRPHLYQLLKGESGVQFGTLVRIARVIHKKPVVLYDSDNVLVPCENWDDPQLYVRTALKEYRARQGSRTEFARRNQVRYHTLVNIEHGQISIPKLCTFEHLCSLVGLRWDYFERHTVFYRTAQQLDLFVESRRESLRTNGVPTQLSLRLGS